MWGYLSPRPAHLVQVSPSPPAPLSPRFRAAILPARVFLATAPASRRLGDTFVTTLPSELAALVERFGRNRQAYHSPAYNETQTRREFIDPLFKALGWDVDNVGVGADGHALLVSTMFLD